eukprot:m.143287 g.143287  ORF g.143287 m.143287 type:complete len:121 (+) comp60684_c0_seq1:66-428(+)
MAETLLKKEKDVDDDPSSQHMEKGTDMYQSDEIASCKVGKIQFLKIAGQLLAIQLPLLSTKLLGVLQRNLKEQCVEFINHNIKAELTHNVDLVATIERYKIDTTTITVFTSDVEILFSLS